MTVKYVTVGTKVRDSRYKSAWQ